MSGCSPSAGACLNVAAKMEGRWGRGDNVSTEDLRQVLRRYRSFFHRLLAA